MFNDIHRNNLFTQRTVCRAYCYTGSFATSVNCDYDFTNSLWVEFGLGFIIGNTPSSSKCCPCRIHPTRSGNKYTRSGDTVTYCQYFFKLFHSLLTFGPKLTYRLVDSLLRRLCSARGDLRLELSVRWLHAVPGHRIAV